MSYFTKILSTRFHSDNISEAISYLLTADATIYTELYSFAHGEDDLTAYNALRILYALPNDKFSFLIPYKNEIIEKVLEERHEGRLRMLLSLLNRMTFDKESLRTDFIDFCLSSIVSDKLSVGIRSLCIKLSYKQCVHYPELLSELKLILDSLSETAKSPAVSSARKNILKKISIKSYQSNSKM